MPPAMSDEAARFWHWHSVRWASALIAFTGVYGWLLASAYRRYLRFSSPWSPDNATGQIVHLKAGNAMFYVRPAEAFWAEGVMPFAWVTAVLGLALFIWAERRPYPIPKDEFAASHAARLLWMTWIELAGLSLALAALLLLTTFGDQIMAFLATGSFATPAER